MSDTPKNDSGPLLPKVRYVPEWWLKPDRKCCICGEKRSVKYDYMDKQYCNLCIITTFNS